MAELTCERWHCPCGCGSHGECFIYGADVPTDRLALVYSRAMNARVLVGFHEAQED